MLNNKKILNNLRDGLPYPYTKSDAEEYITSMLEADKTKTFAFAITVDDKVVGSIGVFRCENIHFRTAEMGYYIGEPYWGNGLGTSAGYENVRIDQGIGVKKKLQTETVYMYRRKYYGQYSNKAINRSCMAYG